MTTTNNANLQKPLQPPFHIQLNGNEPIVDPEAVGSAQEAIGTTVLSITPATGNPFTINAKTAASAKKEDSNHVYPFTKKVRWKGENYKLKIDFPCENWKSMNKDQLRAVTDEYAEHFIADLIETLDAETGEKKIHPGDDFEILFQGSRGYTVFVAPPEFNPLTATDEEISNLKQVVYAKSAQSQAISEIIEKEPSPNTSYAQCIYQSLATDARLASLKNKMSKKNAELAVQANPINLKHYNNNCFINAAFQQLVNDPNPEILKELLDPNNYIHGEENDLYQAIQTYDEHRRLGKSGACDISAILNMEDTLSGDPIIDAMSQFQDRFEEDFLKSHESLFSIPNPVLLEEGLTLDQAAKEGLENNPNESFPLDLNIYTPRISYSFNISEEAKNQFLKDLVQSRYETFKEVSDIEGYDDTVALDVLLENLPKSKAISSEYNHIAETILENDDLRKLALHQLDERQKNPILEMLKNPRQIEVVETAIEVSKDAKVSVERENGSKKVYDLTSFLSYRGSSVDEGHYVTYLKKGDKCWILDDLKPAPIQITQEKFVQAAKTNGCYYRLHTEALDEAVQAEEKGNENKVLKEEKIANTATQFSIEEGTMAMKGFTLINASNQGLFNVHPQLEKEVDAKILQQQINTESAANSNWKGLWKSQKFEPREGTSWYHSEPGMLITSAPKPILHIPLKPMNTQAEIQQATKDVLNYASEQGRISIAFPVFQCKNKSEETVVNWMEQAVKNFVKEKPTRFRGAHIKIVRPEKIKEFAPFSNGKIEEPEAPPLPPLTLSQPSLKFQVKEKGMNYDLTKHPEKDGKEFIEEQFIKLGNRSKMIFDFTEVDESSSDDPMTLTVPCYRNFINNENQVDFSQFLVDLESIRSKLTRPIEIILRVDKEQQELLGAV